MGLMVVTALAVTVKRHPTYTVVAGGLASPRGLTFGPGGRLYVAQAGTGGHTGKISEIRKRTSNPEVRDVVTGLLSIPGEDPGEYVGVDGLSALGNGNIAAIMGGVAGDRRRVAGGPPVPVQHRRTSARRGERRQLQLRLEADHQDLASKTSPAIRTPTACSPCRAASTWPMPARTR